MSFYLNMIMVALLYGMFYLQNRLLYNMCIGSMKKESFDMVEITEGNIAGLKKDADDVANKMTTSPSY